MTLIKRSVKIAGHATSVTLEPEFWDAFKAIARVRGSSVAALIKDIDDDRGEDTNLSSAIRVFTLKTLQNTDG